MVARSDRALGALAVLLLVPGCHLLLPLDGHDSRAGERQLDSAGPDAFGDTQLDSVRPDAVACAEDQGIWEITPGNPYQNPACAAPPPPADDADCDGLAYDLDYHRNQDFWPAKVNPLVLLDGFTRPGLPGWSLQGAPTWTCPAAVIHSGDSMTIDVPTEAGTQYLVQIRFIYGPGSSTSWKIGIRAPTTRTCTLEKTPQGMRYCFKGGCDFGVSWLKLAAGKPFVMQLWSLDSDHAQVGDWCRIFPDGASPSANNLYSTTPTLVPGGTLTLFATEQDFVVDQVRVFAAPVP